MLVDRGVGRPEEDADAGFPAYRTQRVLEIYIHTRDWPLLIAMLCVCRIKKAMRCYCVVLPATSHPGRRVGSRQSLSTTRAASHTSLKVAVSDWS